MAKVNILRWDSTNIIPQLLSEADTAMVNHIDITGSVGNLTLGSGSADLVILGDSGNIVLASGSLSAAADFTASQGAEILVHANVPAGTSFAIGGTDLTTANFTAPNMDTLLDGSNADLLHVHSTVIGSGSLTSSLLIDPDLVHNYEVGGAVGAAVSGTEVVYLQSGDNKVDLADADSVSTGRMIGIASGTTTDTYASGSSVYVFTVYGDRFDGFTGLTAGAVYYLSSTPGAMTTSPSIGSGRVVVQVGIATSATEMLLQPDIRVRGLA